MLVIRAWLAATGYPQIGGHGLHIAHMLFGGLGMLIALLISFSYLGPRARNVAATVGGVGFGAFIDELGKFITSNNNYFYQPTVALIYVVFVLLFLASERMARQAHATPDERLAQAADVVTGLVVEGFPAQQRTLALRLLAESDRGNPLTPALRGALLRIAAAPDPRPGFVTRASQRMARGYASLAEQRWFLSLILVIAGLTTLFNLRQLAITLLAEPERGRLQLYLDTTAGLLLVANILAGSMLLIGLFHLRGDHLDAFQWFRRAVLVSLLLAQPLAFYQQQMTALIGLAFNLVLLSALDFAIKAEIALARYHDVDSPLATGAPG